MHDRQRGLFFKSLYTDPNVVKRQRSRQGRRASTVRGLHTAFPLGHCLWQNACYVSAAALLSKGCKGLCAGAFDPCMSAHTHSHASCLQPEAELLRQQQARQDDTRAVRRRLMWTLAVISLGACVSGACATHACSCQDSDVQRMSALCLSCAVRRAGKGRGVCAHSFPGMVAQSSNYALFVEASSACRHPHRVVSDVAGAAVCGNHHLNRLDGHSGAGGH